MQFERFCQRVWKVHHQFFCHVVFFRPPLLAMRRKRLPVERKIKSDGPKIAGHFRIAEKMAILPSVRACCMPEKQRNALAGLLVIDAVFHPIDYEIDVAARYRVPLGHALPPELNSCRINASMRLSAGK
jgi:hypothetical protein